MAVLTVLDTVSDRLAAVTRMVGLALLWMVDAFGWLLRGRLNLGAYLEQCARIGADSIGMTLLLSAVAGAVLSLQTANMFRQTGAETYVGGLVTLAIVREMAPIFTAMAVGARAGTAVASELGHMRISNQIDALLMMQIQPTRYLVLPRLLACISMLPLLTIIGAVAGVLAGMITAQAVAGINTALFIDSAWLTLRVYDFKVLVIKALSFGLVLGMVCVTLGLSTKGGARQVGVSAMRSAVWIAVLVIVLDFALTWWFYIRSGVTVF